MRSDEASLGFQVGGQQSFIVILFMNEQSAKTLNSDSTEFGGEAAGTAGNTSGGQEGTLKSVERSVLVYDDRHGLFGGAAVKGGALSVDKEANQVYYGAPVTMEEVLFGKKVKSTPKAEELAKKLNGYAKAK
jgi:lipid-binding SYLF domain-containing protein